MRAALTITGLLYSLNLAACDARVGAHGITSVPPDARAQCDTQCKKAEMELSALAIMANTVGCVCQLPSKTVADESTAAAGEKQASAGISAGMATIILQEATRQHQQQMAQSRPR